MQVQAPRGKKGALEGETDYAPPQPSPRAQVHPTEEGSGRKGVFLMQSQMEHGQEGSSFYSLCTKPAGPCSRAVLNQERPLSWRSSAEGARPMTGCLCQLVSGLPSRRQKDSLTCPRHQ